MNSQIFKVANIQTIPNVTFPKLQVEEALNIWGPKIIH